jgi:hypothetical protein
MKASGSIGWIGFNDRLGTTLPGSSATSLTKYGAALVVQSNQCGTEIIDQPLNGLHVLGRQLRHTVKRLHRMAESVPGGINDIRFHRHYFPGILHLAKKSYRKLEFVLQ